MCNLLGKTITKNNLQTHALKIRVRLALARRSGSRGRANFAWSNPSVAMQTTSEFGSADSACSLQAMLLSQNWSWRWARYNWRDPNLRSIDRDLFDKSAFRDWQISHWENKVLSRNLKMSRQRKLYTWLKVVYLGVQQPNTNRWS